MLIEYKHFKASASALHLKSQSVSFLLHALLQISTDKDSGIWI